MGGGANITVQAIQPDAAELMGQHWHSKAAASGSYAEQWIGVNNQQVSIWQVLAGLIGVYGLIQQHALLSRQVDLQERAVDQAEEYLTLSKRNYDEVSLPTFTRMADFYDQCGMVDWKPRVNEFLLEAFDIKHYTPDYDVARGRAVSLVQRQFDNARSMRGRMRGRYQAGACCSEDTMFAIAGAEARVAASNAGYRYEAQRALELDQWYWSRQMAGSQIALNGIANTVSGLTGGAGVATSGLAAIGDSTRTLTQASTAAGESLNNLASFWGSVSNGAFSILGYGVGRSSAHGVFGSSISQGMDGTYNLMSGGGGGGMGGMSGFADVGGARVNSTVSTTHSSGLGSFGGIGGGSFY